MVAIDNNYVGMVKFLLDHGASTDVEAEVNKLEFDQFIIR